MTPEESKQKLKRNLKLIKTLSGITFIACAFVLFLVKHYLVHKDHDPLSFTVILTFILGLVLVIPFELIPEIIFDNYEYRENKTVKELTKKIRLRATLFNNIAIIIFFFTLIVIFMGFYLLVYAGDSSLKVKDPNTLYISLTIRIGASVLLIFLVQILFKVFKYLLRVAAFYLAKADAIEYKIMKPDSDLSELMKLFTPTEYDITDLQQSSVTDNFIEIIKGKFGK